MDDRNRAKEGTHTGETNTPIPAGDSGQEQKDHVEITVNGKNGPTIQFRIGVLAVLNGIILMIGFAVTFSLLKADVDGLKVESRANANQIHDVLQRLGSIQTGQDFIREEVRFLRDELAARDVLRLKHERESRKLK